jgi:UDP-N-acetylmuramoylalanine--D-glutamate ligase
MGQLAVVAGLGKTGQSVIRYLLARGWSVAGTDTRSEPPGFAGLQAALPQVRFSNGRLDESLLEGAAMVVASPGLPQEDPFFAAARARGIEVIGDIELFARSGAGPVAGVTGTNGKSTVTSLVAHMAARAGRDARAGGNLSPPALDLLAPREHGEAPGGAALFVLELSSYQLETTHSLQLAAAVVLNVTADHLDRYTDMDAYAAAKQRIFTRCDCAVLNLDDPRVAAMGHPGQRRLTFSLDAGSGADYFLTVRDGRDWLCRRGEQLIAMDELRIVGSHNAANALAALAMGEALELPRAPMLAALREFAGLPHRAVLVREVAGVRYVNDSKGTNVGATLAAVAGMRGPLLLIAGGDGKNQDFTPLAAAFAGKVRHVFTIGRDAQRIEAVLAGVCPLDRCATLEAAVLAAARVARSGDTVLLSPACASLDMFRDYAHRGEVFTAAVQGLAA